MPKYDIYLLISYLFTFPSSSHFPDILSETLLYTDHFSRAHHSSQRPTSWLTNHCLLTGTFQTHLWCILAQSPHVLALSPVKLVSGLCCTSSWKSHPFPSGSSTNRGWTCSDMERRLNLAALLWIQIASFCLVSFWWQEYPSWHCECRCTECVRKCYELQQSGHSPLSLILCRLVMSISVAISRAFKQLRMTKSCWS